jgi:hypothetical protein
MTDKQQVNARKINKAIYCLLEKYHRLFGLEVYGFSGGHGPGYAGFQVAAKRCWFNGRPHANYEPPFGDGRQILVTYFSHVGIPAWCAGEQLELEGWECKRTSTILAWLEQHLTHLKLFDLYKPEIDQWRSHYTVEQSEKYLLMFNLAGLLSSRIGDFPRTPGQLFHAMDPNGCSKADEVASRLRIYDQHIDAFGIHDCMVGRNGLALVGDEIVDVWAMRTEGKTPNAIAGYLWETRSQIIVD